MRRSAAIALAAAVLAAGRAAPAAGYEAVAVSGGATIRGRVVLAGPPPALPPLPVTKDRAVCGTEVPDESVVADATGGLADAVVSIASIARGKPFPPAESPVLAQRGCRYVPRVLLVPAGAVVTVTNEDGILHNIHTHSRQNPPLNRAHPAFLPAFTHRFAAPEIIPVTCDAHRWMRAWIVVQAHPYHARTAPDGAYELTDVPAGTHELRAWHPVFGERTARVAVAPGGAAVRDFVFTAPGG